MKKIAFSLLSIFISILSATELWTPVQILDSGKDWITHPAVAIDEDGNAIVVWKNDEIGRICASRFNSNSQSWGTVVKLSPPPNELEEKSVNSCIAMDIAGNALVIWDGSFFEAAYYNAITDQWSQSFRLAKGKDHLTPQVGFFPNGNGMAIWYNGETHCIQTSFFEHSTEKWSDPVDIFENITLSAGYLFCFKMDKWGNGCVAWVHGTSENGEIRAAFYDKDVNAWSSAIKLATSTKIYGVDLYFNSNGNPVIIWGGTQKTSTMIIASEYEAKTLNNVSSKMISLGSFPRADAKDSQYVGISSVNGPRGLGAAIILNNDTPLKVNHICTMEGLVVFHDIGIDSRGNAIAAWSKIGNNYNVEEIAYYDATQEMWSIEKKIPEMKGSLGITSVAMHSKGHAIIAWDGIDEKNGSHAIKAMVYQPK